MVIIYLCQTYINFINPVEGQYICIYIYIYILWRAEESHDRVRCNKDPGGCNLLNMVQVRRWKCQLVSCSSAVLGDPPLSSVCCAPCSVLRASNGGLVGHALLSGGENKTLLVSFLVETSLPLVCAEAAFVALAWWASAVADQPAVIVCRCSSSVARATLIGARDVCHNIYIYLFYIYIFLSPI